MVERYPRYRAPRSPRGGQRPSRGHSSCWTCLPWWGWPDGAPSHSWIGLRRRSIGLSVPVDHTDAGTFRW